MSSHPIPPALRGVGGGQSGWVVAPESSLGVELTCPTTRSLASATLLNKSVPRRARE